MVGWYFNIVNFKPKLRVLSSYLMNNLTVNSTILITSTSKLSMEELIDRITGSGLNYKKKKWKKVRTLQ